LLNTFTMIRDLDIAVAIDPDNTEIKGDLKSAAQFFARLHAGSIVKAEGVHGPDKTLDATSGKVEIKDH
jgi:hypothetical protein